MKKLVFSLIACFLFSISLEAQLSFRKYGKKEGKVYLVTEVSLSYPIPVSDEAFHRSWDASSNIGLMYDINERIGIGAHFFLGYYKNGGGHTQHGFRPRVSYYFKEKWQINFAPGIIISDSSYPDGFAGYSIETNVTWDDHLGITIRYDDLVDDDLNGKDRFLNIGIQTDGLKGLGIIVVSGLYGVISNFLRKN